MNITDSGATPGATVIIKLVAPISQGVYETLSVSTAAINDAGIWQADLADNGTTDIQSGFTGTFWEVIEPRPDGPTLWPFTVPAGPGDDLVAIESLPTVTVTQPPTSGGGGGATVGQIAAITQIG